MPGSVHLPPSFPITECQLGDHVCVMEGAALGIWSANSQILRTIMFGMAEDVGAKRALLVTELGI
jgi:hypothetical protein